MRPVKFDLGSSGHLLVVTETGGSHASLTDEYAAVKEENRTVAQFFGMLVLREVDEEDFRTSIPALRNVVGDRAVLRAIHFFDENRRVLEQVGSLEGGDFNKFLKLVNESGISSWTLLQNCYSSKNATEQGITLGLTLGARILNGRGAWRVHGGGFAGTIQAFVPQSLLNDYISGMEQVFGRGACQQLGIRPVGATRLPVMV
jgi:galactokinase